MNTHADKAIIDALGGPAAVARRLGFHSASGCQRVHNWTVRGIPAQVRLHHLDLFGPPDSAADRHGQDVATDVSAHEAQASRQRRRLTTPRKKGAGRG